MIAVHRITIQQFHFLSMTVKLPKLPIHILTSTHTIVLESMFYPPYFDDIEVAVIQCERQLTGQDVVSAVVLSCNKKAYAYGVRIGMQIEDAVVCCENNRKKETL